MTEREACCAQSAKIEKESSPRVLKLVRTLDYIHMFEVTVGRRSNHHLVGTPLIEETIGDNIKGREEFTLSEELRNPKEETTQIVFYATTRLNTGQPQQDEEEAEDEEEEEVDNEDKI